MTNSDRDFDLRFHLERRALGNLAALSKRYLWLRRGQQLLAALRRAPVENIMADLCLVGKTCLLLAPPPPQGPQAKQKGASASKQTLFTKEEASCPKRFCFRERPNPNPDFLRVSRSFQSWVLLLLRLWLSCQVSPPLKPVPVSVFPISRLEEHPAAPPPAPPRHPGLPH